MIKRSIIRLWYRRMLRSQKHRPLSFYEPLWCSSQLIYVGPVGPGAVLHPEARAFNYVAADLAITDLDLVKGLAHPNATFAGYCFEVLLDRRSPLVSDLPAALYQRHEPVSMGLGCISFFQPLGEYVRRRLTAEMNPPAK